MSCCERDIGRHMICLTRNRADRHDQFMPPSTENLPFPRPAETYEFPDPTTQEEKTAFRTKGASKYYDPCGPASQASMRCLDRNNYDRSKCQEAFDAYKECKRMWVGVPCYYADKQMSKKKEDRRNNLPPEKRFW